MLTHIIIVGKKNPRMAEDELLAEFREFGDDAVIPSDDLYEWIEQKYPDLDEGQDQLV